MTFIFSDFWREFKFQIAFPSVMADSEAPPEKCGKCQKRKVKYTISSCSHKFCDECFHTQPKESVGTYLIVSCHCGASESFKKQPAAAKFRFNNNNTA
ncbi:hypothetical protein PFISCL1PPCAC_8633 [Pristionchus fissidentatus]|uniref:RING-type domain-containing protein n=1 Tax=Pristionchus fissidentatus TaxID=1538716 RepID=A0AAV5VD63_9BILA|nr:hypothetical protein PFISCL1PPCAC_8633 [Pristionchus fissidentatus]